jgi:demethoxyubiquinone hydroxylase (CLK1/Coq7/Cat5 family)
VARRSLIRRLQGEHANEGGAARAYHHHAASVRSAEERAAIVHIEQDEWHHRAAIAAMLKELGAGPVGWRDGFVGWIGSTLGVLCYVTGWLAPMIGACLLERLNTSGYAEMARLAELAGLGHMAEPLRRMGDGEADHEAWFRACIRRHWLGRALPLWSEAPRRPRALT